MDAGLPVRVPIGQVLLLHAYADHGGDVAASR
jgi:hypothetical protein